MTHYYLIAEALCKVHQTEHWVTGTATEKAHIGPLKNDLIQILREDYPECKLQPKARIRLTLEQTDGEWRQS